MRKFVTSAAAAVMFSLLVCGSAFAQSIDLQISNITDSVDNITLGQGNVTYTVYVYNATGATTATNIVLTNTLPASSTYVSSTASGTGSCVDAGGGQVSCTWTSLNAGATATATITVTPGAGGTNTFSASVTGDQTDPNPSNNSRSETTTVNATIDLAVYSMSDNPPDITLGQGNVVYTINTYNYSSSKATNPVLTLTLPASSTYVSHTVANSGTCSVSAGVVTCNWPQQNSGTFHAVTLTVTPGAGGTNNLLASIAADQGDHATANNTMTEPTTVNATIDLAVYSMSDSPTDVTLGQGNVVYTINTYNYSSSKATNPVLTLNLPASSTYVSHTVANSGTCSASAGVVTCNWPQQNSGTFHAVTVTVTPGAGGTNNLMASIAADQGDHASANNTMTEPTTVNATINLGITGISDSPNIITLGQGNVVYTINTYNYTSSKATGVVLTATLPASSTYVSHTVANGGTCSQSSGTLTCNWVQQNGFTSHSVTVTVTPTAGGTHTLSANLSATQGDPAMGNNSLSDTTTVNATLDLRLLISDSPDPRVLAAGNVTYTANIYNQTNSKATNPILTFNLPSPSTYVSASPGTGGSCSQASGVVTCTWADIAGLSNRITTIVITPTAVGQLTATGSVVADQGDPNTADNSDTETTNINPGSAPTISSFTPSSGPVGTTVTITGSNFFSSTAVKFNNVNSTFTVATNGSITATVPASATTGPIAITNSVGTTTGGTFTVTPAPNLSITKTASVATTPTSSAFSYTLAVSNVGAGAANDVTVTDTLPAGVTFSSFGANTGWTCSGTTTITCTMGPLAASASAPNITINVIAPPSGTTVNNTATVTSTTPDSSSANNSSTVSVGVVGCPSTAPITAPATVCAGTTGHTASIDAIPSATYAWSITAGNGTITSSTTNPIITFAAGTAASLTLSVDVFVTSCTTVTNTFNVSVSTPTATITPSGPTTFCAGGSVTLTANSGASWLWSNGATTQSVVISANETLTVAVTNAAGCTATSAPVSVVVNTPPAATITASGPTTFCEGGQVTLSAPTGMSSYVWPNGAVSPSIVVTDGGTYAVTVTDSNGCSAASSPMAVTVTAPPDPTVVASGPTTFCTGGSVTLTAPNGTSWLWSNGATTQSVVISATETLTVDVTQGGCTATSTPTVVTVNTPPVSTITPTGSTTFCSGGSVTLTANSGMSSYLWSNGATSPSIVATTAGSYTVTVTAPDGCSGTSAPTAVTVNSAATPVITASGPTSFCTGGDVTLTAPSGMTAYTWSNGVTAPTINVTSSGTFTVTVTDANGCTATSAPTVVTVTPPPAATVTASGPTTFCEGGSVTLNAPSGMASYAWSNGATTPSITVVGTGSYFVTITNSAGCSATSASTSVTVQSPQPASITASGPTTFCPGGNVTLTASSGVSYSWSTGATTPSINVSTSGNYTVVVTDANGCSSLSSAMTVSVTPAPLVNIDGPTATCPGSSIVLDAGPNFATYSWSTGQTTQQITVTPSAATTYTVTVTDSNGCPATDSHTVTVNTTPTATITAPASVCAGTSGHSASVASQPGTTYAWTITGGTFTGPADGSAVTFTAPSSGQIVLGVTASSGTCTSTGSITIPVNPLPAAVITPSGPTTFCTGGSVTLNASAAASYLWSNGATTPSITVNASGNYSVIVTDGSGCSATSATTTVTVNPLPAAIISGPSSTCPGSSVVLDAGANFASYAWSTGATTQQITVTPSAATTYTVTVTNSNGCAATDSHTVTLDAAPTATITAPASVCAGTNGHTASVPSQPGATYAWTITGGVINGPVDSATVSFSAQNTAQVALSVTVTAGTCTATGSRAVPINPMPSAIITAPGSVDASTTGHSASVPAEPGAIYTWSITNGTLTAGAGTPNITFSAGTTGPITLTVDVTLNGCSSSGSASVQVASTIPAIADLSITKSAPASVQAGSQFTYTIQVKNHSAAPSFNAAVVDTLPAGVSVVGFNGGLWTCVDLSGEFRCSRTVPANSSSTITLTVQAPSQAGTITNNVVVNAHVTPDPDSSNNASSATTSVTLPPPVCATAPPALLSPADALTVSSPVTFEWGSVPNAVSYDVWITTGGATTLAGSTSTNSLTRPVPSGTSSWHVVANLVTGCSALTSATRTFTVQPSNTCGNNGRPQLTGPVGGTQAPTVTFSWTAVANAIGYQVWIEVDGTAAQTAGSTDGALSLRAIVPPGSITAYVEARFNACPNTRSDVFRFNVPQPDPCAGRTSAVLIAPANNALINSSAVEMQWTAAANADGYRVWASVDGAAPAVIGETNETSLRTTFERGEVIWFVQSLYDGCAATESLRSRFTIPARNECGNATPELVSPVNHQNVTLANVTFDWNGVQDAIGYEVWLGLDNGTPTLIGVTAASTTSLTHLVPPGELSWFVRALIDRCPTRDSQAARFTFTPPPVCVQNQRPLLSAPLDAASIAAPVDFDWNDVPASRFELFVIRGTAAPALVASTTASEANDVSLAVGNYRWFVRAFFGAGCPPLDSVEHTLEIIPTPAACATLGAPVVSAPGQISSGVEFVIQWTPIAGATSYQLQLSASESFEPSSMINTTATEHELVVNTATSTVRYARVRAFDSRCTPNATVGAFGPVSAIFILPSNETAGSAPLGDGGLVTYTLPLGADLAGQTFTAITTEPWLSVSPASGVVPAAGVVLTVTANTAGLPPGTSLGAVTVNLNASSSRVKTSGSTVTIPFGVSLVTPVTPTPKNTPPPDALVIPVVANAAGISSHFQSDVRVSNTSAQLMKYQLSYVPTGEAGISAGRQTTFTIEPGRTVALDDILKTWFGTGTSNAVGSLEVRPLTEVAKSTSGASVGALANIVTFASSRTFNVTPNGTFGQYIPAIPFANFIGHSADVLKPAVLSLQQIAQSDEYRTNLGFVEASGESAMLLVKVFGNSGQKLTEFDVKLNGGQHTQLNGVLAQHGITSLDDGRVEVQVVSGGGKVTAYASVLDNRTADPLLVSPVTLSNTGNTKWVVPGVADLSNGIANWQSDVRVFNAGGQSTDITLSFVSQNGGAPKTATMTLAAGEVRQLDRVLSLFNVSQDGGALHITTENESRLIATARTYNETTKGTYGQFISAVTPAESVAVGSRPLQLLQVEESARYRSNIGFAEVTGKPVTLEVSIVPPDAKFTATVEVVLGPNEFRQMNSLLAGVGIGDIYNARVSVRAISGDGRATTYASVIDLKTNDPTYIPAQ